MKLKLALFIAVVGFVVLAGCGIPDIPYIEEPTCSSPVEDLDSGEYTVTFTNSGTQNPEYFYGYSIYYKFFDDEDELEESYDDLDNADEKSDLTDEDFRLLYRMENENGDVADAENQLTIPIDYNDRSDSFSLTLSFYDDIFYDEGNDDELFGSTVTFSGTTYYLGRYVYQYRLDSDNTDRYDKSFKKVDFSEDDEDLPGEFEFDEQDDYSVYMAVYVLSYGKNSIGIQITDTEPVFLGNFEIYVSTLD